ncbi:MAG TPA: 3-hydroxybutyryl-CoA dehydrogenase [Pseudonocardia sp.]|nr:3-hydroxybutyryl-CoA dehydrogenase [Pseudonocardia sp.]
MGSDITKVGVVGGGLMGSGIAEVCARASLDVVVVERTAELAEGAHTRLNKSLDRAVRANKLPAEERDEVAERVKFFDSLDPLADRDIVIEAVAENEKVKTEIFAELDRVVTRKDAVLASNTSSIPIMKLGMATKRPQQVVGVHFFNPVPVLKLVELVPSLLTGPETKDRAEAFVTEVLDKRAILCQDRAGFVVNALLVPYLLSAIRMMESGFASAADIDAGMVQGCAHPLGPLQLSDLIGLDTIMAIAESMYAEFKEPLYSPPPLLSRMVDAGVLGRKSGRGFYEY